MKKDPSHAIKYELIGVDLTEREISHGKYNMVYLIQLFFIDYVFIVQQLLLYAHGKFSEIPSRDDSRGSFA
jgi:hypothetical protein